jgi:hypothetical protein
MHDPTTLPDSFIDCQDLLIKEQVEQGSAAYYAKDYASAICILLPIVHDPVAQCFLGLTYLDDPEQEAMRNTGWENLTASAEAGFEYAWYALANRYLDLEKTPHNLLQASRWFRKGAELGCASSQYSLGWCLCRLEDYLEATKWLCLAVALGNSNALGLCESVAVNMKPGEWEHGRTLALKWLDLKEQGPVERYHGPLQAYCGKNQSSL